jgi:hypothetical protein
MISQPRRTERKKFLDASVIPVEQALLTRAGALRARAELHPPQDPEVEIQAEEMIAREFETLAEELHFW